MTALLRRVLPEVSPQTLASILEVNVLPPRDYSIIASGDQQQIQPDFDPSQPAILDVFLACIAKALTLQTKVKGQAGGKGVTSFRLMDCMSARFVMFMST